LNWARSKYKQSWWGVDLSGMVEADYGPTTK
jgi:hypothetical protein